MKTVIKYFLLLMLSFVLGYCFTITIWFTVTVSLGHTFVAADLFLKLSLFFLILIQFMIYLLGRKSLFSKRKYQIIINIVFFALSIFCYLVSSFYVFVFMFNYGMSGL